MRFSIIVPVYNVEKYIGKCMESLVSQNYSDYEIIVVDDMFCMSVQDCLQVLYRHLP